jgi:hypothetical protein
METANALAVLFSIFAIFLLSHAPRRIDDDSSTSCSDGGQRRQRLVLRLFRDFY